MGRFAEAIDAYQQARRRADAGLRTKIDYGLGNTLLCLGDLAGAVREYDACLASTARGPGLDAVRRDAAVNRRFAIEKLQSALGQSERERPVPDSEERALFPPGKATPARTTSPANRRRATARATASDDPQRLRGGKTGGAGGAGRRPPGDADESPGDRLDAAVDEIRDARRGRLPDEPPADDPRLDRKDW